MSDQKKKMLKFGGIASRIKFNCVSISAPVVSGGNKAFELKHNQLNDIEPAS